MKNYIDSQEHWEDSINADYEERKRINKLQERQIQKQVEQMQGQELPISNVVERSEQLPQECIEGFEKSENCEHFRKCEWCNDYFGN